MSCYLWKSFSGSTRFISCVLTVSGTNQISALLHACPLKQPLLSPIRYLKRSVCGAASGVCSWHCAHSSFLSKARAQYNFLSWQSQRGPQTQYSKKKYTNTDLRCPIGLTRRCLLKHVCFAFFHSLVPEGNLPSSSFLWAATSLCHRVLFLLWDVFCCAETVNGEVTQSELLWMEPYYMNYCCGCSRSIEQQKAPLSSVFCLPQPMSNSAHAQPPPSRYLHHLFSFSTFFLFSSSSFVVRVTGSAIVQVRACNDMYIDLIIINR